MPDNKDDQSAVADRAELLAFAVVGNVLDIPRVPNEEGVVYLGTKAFSPGTKVHMGLWFWGTPEAGGYAIGRNRVSGRLTKAVVPGFLLSNFRPTGIYSASLHSKLVEREAELFGTKEEALESALRFSGASRYARSIDFGGKFSYLDIES